jgi:hypothetical protein
VGEPARKKFELRRTSAGVRELLRALAGVWHRGQAMVRRRPANAPKRRARASRNRNRRLDERRLWLKGLGWAGRRLSTAPAAVRVILILVLLPPAFTVTNLVYQVVRKPTEVFFPLSSLLNKEPAETWRAYGPLFREYSTATIAPELLAALAQAESAGNPVAQTYWRWRLTWRPFAIYQPASSAVGLYQMTDAAFADARPFCIQHHVVVAQGCRLKGAYTRILPSHAIELAAIYLDRNVTAVLGRRPATVQQMLVIATIIHLCGAGPALTFVQHGFHLDPGEHCGDHETAAYLARVDAMTRDFRRLAGGS